MSNATLSSVDRLDVVADAMRAFVRAANKHIGGGLSSVELTTAVFFGAGRFLGGAEPGLLRDQVVLSKGHAPSAYYFALWLLGYFGDLSLDELLAYGSPGHPIPRMPRRCPERGIDMSTGALGQGLSFANGLAAADRRLGFDRRTFVILGDAECGEGQVWEAADTAVRLGLRNLTAIVDVNGFGSGIDIRDHPWAAKWRAFGWAVVEVDGHDVGAVAQALQEAAGAGPCAVLARTVKGWSLPDGLAGTSRVHNSVSADLVAHEDLRPAVDAALDALPERGRTLPVAPPLAPAAEITVDALRSFPRGEVVHVKKFGGDLVDLLDETHRAVLVTPDAVSNSGLGRMLDRWGTWHWDNAASPIVEGWIAEQDAASLAAGFAANGLQSALFLMEGFVWRMLDSIRESICFPGLPVTIVGTSGGLGDSLGPMVQSDVCLAALVDLPRLECFEATDANEVRLLFALARSIDGPTYLRTPHEEVPTLATMEELRARSLEDGAWVLRDPAAPDAVVVAAGSTVLGALEATDRLAAEGIECRVVQVFGVTRLARSSRRQDLIPPGLPAVSVHNSSPSVLGRFLGPCSAALGLRDYGESGKPLPLLFDLHGIGPDAVVEHVLRLVKASDETRAPEAVA